DADSPRRGVLGRRLIWAAVVVAVLALLGAGLYWAYVWSQRQYYVGPADGQVAIYQGIPQEVFGFELSHVARQTGVSLAGDLTESYRQQVEEASLRNVTLEQAVEWVDDAVAQSRSARRETLGGAGDRAASPAPSRAAASSASPSGEPAAGAPSRTPAAADPSGQTSQGG
ncbi:MAG: hypothetical protein LBD70_04410, partial [Bifidobacteriaceae bacterium]|nr:hypothetical protein [Bifidobacteriaceae bacterium]